MCVYNCIYIYIQIYIDIWLGEFYMGFMGFMPQNVSFRIGNHHCFLGNGRFWRNCSISLPSGRGGAGRGLEAQLETSAFESGCSSCALSPDQAKLECNGRELQCVFFTAYCNGICSCLMAEAGNEECHPKGSQKLCKSLFHVVTGPLKLRLNIRGWVKTLYPFCSPQNSWDLWMFIPL